MTDITITVRVQRCGDKTDDLEALLFTEWWSYMGEADRTSNNWYVNNGRVYLDDANVGYFISIEALEEALYHALSEEATNE